MLVKLTKDGFKAVTEPALEPIDYEAWRDGDGATNADALYIPNSIAIEGIEGDLDAFDVIVLDFPKFGDGRAYSQARLLRERYGFQGEIRAQGEVLRDQVLFMVRCGFDALELARADVESAEEALAEFSHAYQAAADSERPVWSRRRDRAEAA